MSYHFSKPWWHKSYDDAPAEYFRGVVAPTIPELPPEHPRRQFTRDFYGVWTNKSTGERLLPDEFARLEMEFDRNDRQISAQVAAAGGGGGG